MSELENGESIANNQEEKTPSVQTLDLSDLVNDSQASEQKTTQPSKPVIRLTGKTEVVTLPNKNNKQNTNVDKIKSLTSKFEQAYEHRDETISILIGICNFLNTTNDPKVFQVFTTWFLKNSSGYMDDQVALRGIHTIQNKRTKTKVEATHQCFMELARVLRSRPRSRYRFTVRAMRAMEISERLSLWLIQRASA